MKKLITTLALLLTVVTVYAYNANYTYRVYNNTGSLTESSSVDPEPATPYNNGGCVFKISYDDDIPFQMKAAFEHACKLWEERMYNCLPITIAVHLDKISNTSILSQVKSTVCTSYEGGAVNKLVSTIKFCVLSEIESNHYVPTYDSEVITDSLFFDNPDKPDISITYNYNISDLFSYTLAETSPTNKYDFISIALRDLRAGLGHSSINTPLQLGAVERGNVLQCNWSELGWAYYTPSGMTSDPIHLTASGSKYVAPYKGSFSYSWKNDHHGAPKKETGTKNTKRKGNNNLTEVELYCFNHCPDLYYIEGGRTKGNDYVLSLLRKDGTWQIIADTNSKTFNLETLNISQYDTDLFARTSKGDLRARLDDIYHGSVHFGYESRYNLCENYFSMSYLPQAVQLNYEGVEYVNNLTGMTEDKIDPNPLNIDLSKYTKYHRISLKDTEGANMLRIFNGSNIMVNRNFKSGSFRLKDNGKPTLVSVTAVNDNGSTAGGNVSYNLGTAVGPIHPFQPLLKSNGQTLTFVPDGKDSTETDHLVSYAISSVSELNQTTMTGEFEEDQTVDISTLRPGMYVINCLGASGNTYSFKFTKK